MKNGIVERAGATAAKHWSRVIAESLLEERGGDELFTCASGISPSGPVHVGNLRDVLTIAFVGRQLKSLGARVRLIHSWDDFDRFRKAPAGFPESYREFIGRPVSKVPDPSGKHPSFADRCAAEFEEAISVFGLEIEFKSQARMYASGTYGPAILEALRKRNLIFDIINGFRTEPLPESRRDAYLPIEIYCGQCHRDGTAIEILDEAAGMVRYDCPACKNREEISILTAGNVKLPWKIDWPMRWRHERVLFEPGGKDHATAGGSFLVASEISRRVFQFEPPRFQGYEFIGLKGVAGKMSSSAGIAVTPGEALNIYEPEVLLWLFAKAPPMRAFDLPLDQRLVQVYDEFDKAVAAARSNPAGPEAESVALAGAGARPPEQVPFKTVSSLVALLDGNLPAVLGALGKLGFHVESDALKDRIRRADYWLDQYLPEDRIRILPAPNASFIAALSEEEKSWMRDLVEWVKARPVISEEAAQEVFQIPISPEQSPQEKKVSQRRFFRCVYQLLFGRDNGPRLPTFLAAIPRERYLSLLEGAR